MLLVALYLGGNMVRSFLKDLNLTLDDPVKLLCDNTTTIQFAKNPKFHLKTKHIKRRYRFVRKARDCD